MITKKKKIRLRKESLYVMTLRVAAVTRVVAKATPLIALAALGAGCSDGCATGTGSGAY